MFIRPKKWQIPMGFFSLKLSDSWFSFYLIMNCWHSVGRVLNQQCMYVNIKGCKISSLRDNTLIKKVRFPSEFWSVALICPRFGNRFPSCSLGVVIQGGFRYYLQTERSCLLHLFWLFWTPLSMRRVTLYIKYHS